MAIVCSVGLSLSAGVGVAVVSAARLMTTPRFTVFSLAGYNGRCKATVRLTQREVAVRLSVTNHEGAPRRYEIAARVSGHRVALVRLPLLASGEVWTGSMRLPARALGHGRSLILDLLRPERSGSYRFLRLPAACVERSAVPAPRRSFLPRSPRRPNRLGSAGKLA